MFVTSFYHAVTDAVNDAVPNAVSAASVATPPALAAALSAALLWWMPLTVITRRMRRTPQLHALSDADVAPIDAPMVSVILPARNEAAHIDGCLASLCASEWPALDIVVVDDHSTDDTRARAERIAARDPRVRIVDAPPLPPGWFGKQWACENGAAAARGALLLFTDADTRHHPELIHRLVAIRAARGAELMSVAGKQDMLTVWEQAVQPSVFALLLLRYGGADQVERARSPRDVLANGQCFLISRAGYDAIGRHAAVRQYVAEDLMIAQAVHRSGRRVSLALGAEYLRTRMYEGLGPLLRGWGKNVYAGGRYAMRGGAFGQALYPVLLLAFPLAILAPFVLLAWALSTGAALPLVAFGVVAAGAVLATFAFANALNGDARWRAIYAPLGGLVLLVICVRAVLKRQRVEWKGRDYVAG